MSKDRTKNKPTPRQNKWKDPFYYRTTLFRFAQCWYKLSLKQEAKRRSKRHEI